MMILVAVLVVVSPAASPLRSLLLFLPAGALILTALLWSLLLLREFFDLLLFQRKLVLPTQAHSFSDQFVVEFVFEHVYRVSLLSSLIPFATDCWKGLILVLGGLLLL